MQPLQSTHTGATGLVGCRLASKLASQGHTVRALTRNPGSARSKLPFPGVEVYGPADWAKAIQVTLCALG
eukprot:1161040-Pelagomonas_calceolata.AAC.2